MSTTLDSETTMQLVVLEEMFNDDCECEATHEESVCSVTVTHRTFGCYDPLMVCFNSAQSDLKAIEARVYTCAYCGRPIEDCWRIIPI